MIVGAFLQFDVEEILFLTVAIDDPAITENTKCAHVFTLQSCHPLVRILLGSNPHLHGVVASGKLILGIVGIGIIPRHHTLFGISEVHGVELFQVIT